jgi:hypothetical protein
MYLGRIITKSKNVETIEFVDVTNDKSLAKDCTIPTLDIGKKNIQEIVGKENVHFLNKKVSDNLYWTFAKTEQRNEYEKDLKEFNNILLKRLVSNIQYKYLNIFTEPLSTIKRFIAFMNGNAPKVVYISYTMVYVYFKNTVYGISLTDLSYIGIKRDKVFRKLKQNERNVIITNDYFLTKDVKRYIKGSKILVPYIFFLQNT